MTTATIEQLRDAVTEMDSMSQTAFTEIATFAKLAVGLLETPHAYKDPEALACLLQAIWNRAQDAENCINCMAEGVGCNHTDLAPHRRTEALRKAHESTSIGRA
jgi:hypothetical protein